MIERIFAFPTNQHFGVLDNKVVQLLICRTRDACSSCAGMLASELEGKMFFRQIEAFGCLALLGAIFVVGGLLGLLVLGWKALLGF